MYGQLRTVTLLARLIMAIRSQCSTAHRTAEARRGSTWEIMRIINRLVGYFVSLSPAEWSKFQQSARGQEMMLRNKIHGFVSILAALTMSGNWGVRRSSSQVTKVDVPCLWRSAIAAMYS